MANGDFTLNVGDELKKAHEDFEGEEPYEIIQANAIRGIGRCLLVLCHMAYQDEKKGDEKSPEQTKPASDDDNSSESSSDNSPSAGESGS